MKMRSFKEFRSAGLLWLINRVIFHPRGYALAFHIDASGLLVGWSILGNGKEVYAFSEADDDEGFAATKRLFESLEAEQATPCSSSAPSPASDSAPSPISSTPP